MRKGEIIRRSAKIITSLGAILKEERTALRSRAIDEWEK